MRILIAYASFEWPIRAALDDHVRSFARHADATCLYVNFATPWSRLLASVARPDVIVAGTEVRAAQWLTRAAGGAGRDALTKAIVTRYGKDRTFSVPILTMCALAGRFGVGASAWRLVPQLPFEFAVIPRRLYTIITLPVVSYALPALIAMGLARHRRRQSSRPRKSA